MKTFKKLLKEQHGFTLVELMVVVAIIGVLSAVAVPNFKKYQAKAKTSEAKVQLAAAYTAQQAFFGDFGMYGACLSYMGYDPANERNSRYYAVGFETTVLTTVNADTLVTAVNSGIGSECVNKSSGAYTAANGFSHFAAGKSLGSIAATTTLHSSVLTCLSAQANSTGNNTNGEDCLSTAQEFVIGAQGTVSRDKQAATDNSVFLINESKVMTNQRAGY